MRAHGPVHALAADAALSLMRAAAYARGGDGDNECPTRYYRIVNEAACESAAAAAGALYIGNFSQYAYPSGCLSLQGQGVYLNTDPTGFGYPGAQLLCSGATPLARSAYTLRNPPMAVLTGVPKGTIWVRKGLVARR